jgi:hypothetical protein
MFSTFLAMPVGPEKKKCLVLLRQNGVFSDQIQIVPRSEGSE